MPQDLGPGYLPFVSSRTGSWLFFTLYFVCFLVPIVGISAFTAAWVWWKSAISCLFGWSFEYWEMELRKGVAWDGGCPTPSFFS